MAPYTPSGHWSVEYFQINGCNDGVGECAIILLVDTQPTDGTAPKKRIVSAVLIDTGQGENIVKNLVATMNDIKAQYSGIPAAECLKFDAIIISHWDRDHYWTFATLDEWGYFADETIGVKSGDITDPEYGLVQSFKYEYDASTPPKLKGPATRFYCEYWGGVGAFPSKATGRVHAGTEKDMDNHGTVLRSDPFDIQLQMSDKEKSTLQGFFKGTAAQKQKVKDLKLVKPAVADTVYYRTPCLVGYCQPKSMLGMNVFTGEGLNTTTQPFVGVTHVTDLLTKNPPDRTLSNAPGLYIVGVQRVFLGPEYDVEDNENLAMAPSVQEGQGNASQLDDGVEPSPSKNEREGDNLGVINDMKTFRKGWNDTNPASVINLLVWNEGTKAAPKPRISLYSGGDSEWVTEMQLVHWLKQDPNTLRATCIKSGHHGSKAGTSVSLIQQLNPDHIIFSAGYMHAHPTHELLLYLDAWWRSQTAGPKLYGPRIHSVCHPYWLMNVKYNKDLDPGIDFYDRKNQTFPTYFRSQVINTSSYDASNAADTTKNANSGLKQYQEDLAKAYADWPAVPSPTMLEEIQQDVETFVNGAYATTSKTTRDTVYKEYKDAIAALAKTKASLRPAKKKKLSVDDIEDLEAQQVEQEEQVVECGRMVYRKWFNYDFQAFRQVAPIFDNLWLRWSNIDYAFCPIKGQPATKKMRHLKARFVLDGGTYTSEFGWCLVDGSTLIFDQPTKTKAAALVESRSEANAQSGLPGNKRKGAPVEIPHESMNGYTLLSNLEIEMLNCENADPQTDDDDEMADSSEQGDTVMAEESGSSVLNQQATTTTPTSITQFEAAVGAPFTSIWPSGTGSGDGVLVVSADSFSLDSFVNSLPDAGLSVDQGQIEPGTSFVGTLSPTDSLLAWWSSMLPTTTLTSPSVSIAGLLADSAVTAMGITFSFTTPDGHTLNYTSTSLEDKFQVSAEDLHLRTDDYGQLVNNTGVMLGLNMDKGSASVVLSLRNLFDMASVTVPVWAEVNSVAMNKTVFRFGGGINGLWFYPMEQLLTQIRFDVRERDSDGDVTIVDSIMAPFSFLQCEFSACSVVAIRRYTSGSDIFVNNDAGRYGRVGGQVTINTNMSLNVHGDGGSVQSHLDFDSFLTLGEDMVSIVLRWSDSTRDPLDTFLAWIEQVMHLDQVFDKSLLEHLPTSEDQSVPDDEGFTLRQVTLCIEKPSGAWKITSFSMTFEIAMKFGLVSQESKVPFDLTFLYRDTGGEALIDFKGSLWQNIPTSVQALRNLSPETSPVPLLMPSISTPTQYYVSLPDVFGKGSRQVSTLPSSIPTLVTAAQIEVFNSLMSLSGTLSSSTIEQDPPTNVLANVAPPLDGISPSSSGPSLALTKVEAAITYTFGPPACFYTSFKATIFLQPRFSYPLTAGATLFATMTLDEAAGDVTWAVEAQGTDFNAAALYSLFPNTENGAVMNVLEEISIRQFDIRFVYDSAGSGKYFVADGTLLLGPVELDLDFRYGSASSATESSSTWSFDAKARLEGTVETTLGEILGGISSDLAAVLPSFITGTSLAVTPADFIDLECHKTDISGGGSRILFSIIAKVGSFEFSFIQVADNLPISSSVKRLLRITLDALPSPSTFPLIGKLEQPFDSMDFVWVDGDLSRSDLEAINVIYSTNKLPIIVCKDPRQSTDKDPTTLYIDPSTGVGTPSKDIVIPSGCHFVVVVEQNNSPTAILDYNFDGGQTTPTQQAPKQSALPPTDPVAQGPGSSTLFTKTLGPLSISSIKLTYEQAGTQTNSPSYLSITFDAKVLLGPVSGLFFGFGLRFPLASMHHLTVDDITPLFSGLGLELNRPPVSLAGTLIKTGADGYEGGLSISIDPYNLLGGGYYGHPSGTYESVFAFAEVDGPLVELEFASLSNVVAGFGYHSQLTLPTVDNVTAFPFLKSPTQSDPLGILKGYLADLTWFTPFDGKNWLTAGLTAKAFHALTISAAVVLDLDTDVIFGIFAHVNASIPAEKANDAEKFAVADMGLCALMDYGKGIFQVEGQLTPASYILSKDCKLRGGFALCYWFDGSGHEGDWVFTVGGYHSAFQIPQWYPKPQRLSISWPMGDVNISGDAFFAITPKCCMGGGHLHVGYSSGSLAAWFDAFADFLINYSPFYFIADVGVSIGISYSLHIGCIHKKWDIDFSASLHLHGPPVAGTVFVSWCIISFTIHFGETKASNNPLGWEDFMKVVQQYDPSTQKETQMQTITATDGLLDDPSASPSQVTTKASTVPADPPVIWTVSGTTFTFAFTSLFPVTKTKYNDYDTTDPKMVSLFNGTDNAYMKPMHISNPVDSQCTISIKDGTDASAEYKDFGITPIVKQVPAALWGEYTSGNDPSGGASVSALLNGGDGATCNLVMGFELTVPPPLDNGPIVGVSTSECMFDCLEGTAIADPKLYQPDNGDMARAYDLWLPSTAAGSMLSYPTEYSAEYWQSVEDAWQHPSQSVPDLILRWSNVCGANDGVKFTDRLADFGTTSAPPQSLIENLPDLNFLPPLYTPPRPHYVFNILSATWNAMDVTVTIQKIYQAHINTDTNTFTYLPTYQELGDPNPFHAKQLTVLWSASVSYPQYYDPQDLAQVPYSTSRPQTASVLEGATLTLDFSRGLTFGDPKPDNNGRAILSAAYWTEDRLSLVTRISRSSANMCIPVSRSLYANPPPGDAQWPLNVSYMIMTPAGSEYRLAAAADGNSLLIAPGVTPEPRLTIHRAMWAQQDMTDQLYALVTYQQTLTFNVDKGKFPASWTNPFPADLPKSWSVMYQYGNEPLELLVAVDDGSVDSGVQVIDYSQRPKPDRRLFFNATESRRVGENNILAIVWGHNRDKDGVQHAVSPEVYDIIGNGNFMCTNDAFGFDGGWGYGKTCHVFYQYGLDSAIQCNTEIEWNKPIPRISYYDDPSSPMPGRGLFVQNAVIGGCWIQSMSMGGYLTFAVDQETGAPVIRTDGQDPSQALIFKASLPSLDPDSGAIITSAPLVQAWDPKTQKIYQLQLDRTNTLFPLDGPTPSSAAQQLRVEFSYELDPSTSSLILSPLPSSTMATNDATILTCPVNMLTPTLISTLSSNTLSPPVPYSPYPSPSSLFRLIHIPPGPHGSVGPRTIPLPIPTRISNSTLTPAISTWVSLLATLTADLATSISLSVFADSTPSPPPASVRELFVQKWWVSITPGMRAQISKSLAALIAMSQPASTADMFSTRARILWQQLYELGILWDLLTFLAVLEASSPITSIDATLLFAQVSARVLKRPFAGQDSQTQQLSDWCVRAAGVWNQRTGAVPLGCADVEGDLAALMTTAATRTLPAPVGASDEDIFVVMRRSLEGWEEIVGRVDP